MGHARRVRPSWYEILAEEAAHQVGSRTGLSSGHVVTLRGPSRFQV